MIDSFEREIIEYETGNKCRAVYVVLVFFIKLGKSHYCFIIAKGRQYRKNKAASKGGFVFPKRNED